MIYIYFNFARRKPRLSWIRRWSFCILKFTEYIKESIRNKKRQQFLRSGVTCFQNQNKKCQLFFLHLYEICTSMAYDPGPGNVCLDVSQNYQHYCQLEFSCPKDKALEPHHSRLIFPQWGRWCGQAQSKELRCSLLWPGWALQSGRNFGGGGHHCIPAVVSAAQMTGIYGNTNRHGSAGPRHREN